VTTPEAPTEVTVTVPATSANLGPGFDALGLAVQLYDDVHVGVRPEPGVAVTVEGEGAADVPRDETHLVVRAIYATFAHLGVRPPGLYLRCRNEIPHGRGLGSSAAAIVAGVLAARELCGGLDALGEADTLALAARIEGHPDNVAACLLGGVTVAWQEAAGARAVRLDPHPELAAVLFVPNATLATEQARGLLPDVVPHGDAAHAAGRAALLVEALTRRPDLLLAGTEDRLHQAYRAGAMPQTAALVEELRSHGVAAVVSGAGPTVLALVEGAAAHSLAQGGGPYSRAGGWSVRHLALDRSGARVR
jgi:homoserine kinase